jgi:hypothetical protein
MQLTKYAVLTLLVLILLVPIIGGHFLPPMGTLLTPITVSLTTALIALGDDIWSGVLKSLLAYVCIGLNDIGTKLFAGGIYDAEGIGWIHMMLFIGLVPAFIILAVGVFRSQQSTLKMKILSMLLFVVLLALHFEVFATLGVTQK